MPERILAKSGGAQGAAARGDDEYLQDSIGLNRIAKARNVHPTVKPLALMSYLVRLVTMPGRNLILDPFMGSGTTGMACAKAGIPFIGIELNQEYCEIAKRQIGRAHV